MNTEEVIEKDLVIKLGPKAREQAKKILSEINSIENYPKKITFKDLFEYLLEKNPTTYVEDLVKLRIQPEDTLKQMYLNSGSTLSYPEWVLERVSLTESYEKKVAKKKVQGGVSV